MKRFCAESSLVFLTIGAVGVGVGLDDDLVSADSTGGYFRLFFFAMVFVAYFVAERVAATVPRRADATSVTESAGTAFFLSLAVIIPAMTAIAISAFLRGFASNGSGHETELVLLATVAWAIIAYVVTRIIADFSWPLILDLKAEKAHLKPSSRKAMTRSAVKNSLAPPAHCGRSGYLLTRLPFTKI